MSHLLITNTTNQQLRICFAVRPAGLGAGATSKHKHTKRVEQIFFTVFQCFVCWDPSVAGAQRNTPKGKDKHPWRQLRFRVVAPLFITCPVDSVTAEGDRGKGREWAEREPDTQTEGGLWISEKRKRPLFFCFVFFPLTGALCDQRTG